MKGKDPYKKGKLRREDCQDTPPERVGLPRQHIESPIIWMKEKATADRERYGVPSHLWCLSGKLYDLSKFKHPGGNMWIHETKGQDITVAFNTHHPLAGKKANALLKKYYIKDAIRTFTPQPFTFKEGGFYRTLQARAKKILIKSGGTGPTKGMIFASTVSLLLFFAFFFATTLASPSSLLISMVYAVATGITLHALIGVGHNFFHQADGWWMYTFDLTMFSSHHWRISHAISHHLYPNTDLDAEVSSLEPVLFFMSNRPHNSVIVYVTYHIFLALASTVDFMRHWVYIVLKKESFRLENLIVIVEFLILAAFHPFLHAMLLFFTMHCVSSWLLASLSFAVHRTEYAWTEGDIKGERDNDYGRHIMATTHDHSVSLPLLPALFFFAGLNYHCLHHLFPTVDRSRLYLLDGVLQKTCKEFGVEHDVRSFAQLYRSSLRRHDMRIVPA